VSPHQQRRDAHAFGRRLSTLRLARNWTQYDLAAEMDVHHKTITFWENGRVTPPVRTLARLADLFDTTMDHLWRGT
jgi:transcriptional regulator with XRE-family HTH domain